MTRREKLIQKTRNSPGSIRFSEVEAVQRAEGFALFNRRRSHRTYHHPAGKLLTIVRPRGGRKTCHPQNIRKLLEVLGL
jgi:predicted RNA binding protein YcfA (HicA-like mRNA interferase family)